MRVGDNQAESLEATAFSLPSLMAAAHELKSPLVLIRQLAMLAGDENVSVTDRAIMLRRVSLTSERALRLTGDLTRSARLDDALFDVEPIEPVSLCRDIINELTPLFAAHGKTLSVRSRRHPLLLVANRDLLRRIVMNFSDNALHYASEGSVVEIQVQALRNARTIRVGVRDFGPALSAKMWQDLQSKLSSAPQPVHARPQSSGLGLYIAARFAEAMDGRIGAIRHRNGATFYVDLDASRQLSLL